MEKMELKESEFKEKVLQADKKVLVDFYANWCGPCKMLSEVISRLNEEVKDYDIYKVDVDKCPNLSREYKVMSIPNLMIFNQGKLIKSDMGFKTEEELKEFLDI